MNTAVYLLRAKQMGLTVLDLEQLEEGMIMDMIIESGNDNYDGYKEIADQSDFDSF